MHKTVFKALKRHFVKHNKILHDYFSEKPKVLSDEWDSYILDKIKKIYLHLFKK